MTDFSPVPDDGQLHTAPVEPPFPFIVGCGRSGTTLLRAVFDSHPDLAIPGESHFLVPMVLRRGRYETAEGLMVDTLVDDLVVHPRFRKWNISRATVRSWLQQSAPGSLADAVRAVYGLYASREGKRRYGDKTPNYVENIPELADLLPEARFVHLIRDGRDVALSLIAQPWGPPSLEMAVQHWKRCVRWGRAAGAELGPDRYREVRYEELVRSPEPIIRSLCDFIAIKYSPAMIRHEERAPGLMATISAPQSHQGVLRPITENLRDWRLEMPREDVRVVESIAGGTLVEMGYEL